MKYSSLLLVSLMSLPVFSTSHAQQGDADGSNCKGKTWPDLNDIKCINKGGSVSCVSSTIVCCKANSQGGRTCSDDPDDLPMKPQVDTTPTLVPQNRLVAPITQQTLTVQPDTTAPKATTPNAVVTPDKSPGATPPPKTESKKITKFKREPAAE